MIVGPLCAAFVSLPSVAIALVLVGLILAYDRFLKHLPVGPIAMGRSHGSVPVLQCHVGRSAAGTHIWNPPQLFVALAMGTYVGGVTWFARQEAAQSSRSQLTAAAAVCHVAIVGLAVHCDRNAGGRGYQSLDGLGGTRARDRVDRYSARFRSSRTDASKCASGGQAAAPGDRGPRRDDGRLQDGRPAIGAGSRGTLCSGGDAWPLDFIT